MTPQTERTSRRHVPALQGARLTNIRCAQSELVLSFSREDQDEIHLICKPEGHVINGPDGQPIPVITGMKYETGTGALIIMQEATQLAGEAYEIIGQLVTGTALDSERGIFGVQFGEYAAILSQNGLQVIHSKELKVEFQKPLLTV